MEIIANEYRKQFIESKNKDFLIKSMLDFTEIYFSWNYKGKITTSDEFKHISILLIFILYLFRRLMAINNYLFNLPLKIFYVVSWFSFNCSFSSKSFFRNFVKSCCLISSCRFSTLRIFWRSMSLSTPSCNLLLQIIISIKRTKYFSTKNITCQNVAGSAQRRLFQLIQHMIVLMWVLMLLTLSIYY